MKEQAVRTTVDIPASLYRKLKEQAAAQGRSIRELILLGVRVTLIGGMSCLSWNWRRRSSVKITERTHEKRAKALHRRREGCHPETALVG